VAGVAQCWTEGFVKDLAVRPAFRGRGLGEALLHAVFAEFARRGVREVRLKVDADNPTGAVRLYERVGMRELRRHAVYARG
jgi:ribosomal protein S18 acetylase RimI-like enzyme